MQPLLAKVIGLPSFLCIFCQAALNRGFQTIIADILMPQFGSNPSQLQDVFTSFLSVYKICKMFLGGQPVGCIAFTFDHLTHSTHPPKLNSKPLHVLFLYIWPHVVPSHLSSPRQKRTDRQAPNGTFGGRARIGQSLQSANPPFQLGDVHFKD